MNSPAPQQNEAALHAVDYWQVIKNRYGIILLTLLLVFMTAAVITYVMPKKYESKATIEVKPKGTGMSPFGGREMDDGTKRMTSQFFGTEFEKIKSSNSLTKVIENLDLAAKWGMDKDSTLIKLKSIVNTQNIRGTDLISISVRYTDKVDAKNICSEVAKAYTAYRAGIETRDADKGIAELKKAIQVQADKVEDLSSNLTTIAKTKQIIYEGQGSLYGLSGGNQDQGARSAGEAYDKALREKSQLESQINSLLKINGDELLVTAVGLDLDNNIIRALYPEYLEKVRIIDTLKNNGLGEQHPTVKSAKDQKETLKQQLDEGVVNLRKTLQTKLSMAEGILSSSERMKKETREKAINHGIDARDYVDAKRLFEYEQEILQSMEIKIKTVEVSERISEQPIEVHEEAQISQNPVSPNVMLNLGLGAIVGLIFGVGIAFFLEYLDTSVKSLEDVERYLQVPVLAVIPQDVGILHKQNGMSPDAEAYRILRTNIEFNRKNPEDNAITVVSGGAGEGKSTTLVNLAYICAQGGYTTLMIDADLRRPRLHTFFDINNSVGLTNYLTTELMLEDVILQTPVDNLYFMPSGILPADAAGILNSRRMSELIQDVKQRFDLVLVDSPPILGVSDASVLASEVDLTMIVVQHRKLPRNMLLRVKQAVENVGGNVIGVVLNNVDVRSDSQYQYYTSYYTYYAPTESQANVRGKPTSSPTQVAARGNDSDLF
jgi:polysaccharide biosynthesis transport protein